MPRRVYSPGFTLAEILISVAIILLLMGISLALLKSLQPSLQLSGSIRDLITDLRYAQQITITEQIKYCVKLFLDEKKYQIRRCATGQVIVEKFLGGGIQAMTASGFSDNEIEFNPYGAAKQSGQITLENTNGQIKTIEVRPSGFVKIIN